MTQKAPIMLPAKRHRIIAVFFDIMVIGSVVQVINSTILALTSAAFYKPLATATGISYLLAIILYHTTFAKRVAFCTPGEMMAGCRRFNEEKSWYTLFTKSRWFLFLTLIFLLILPANAFDEMQAATEYPVLKVAGRSIYVIIILLSIYRLALGHFRWARLLFVLLAFQAVSAYGALQTQPELAKIALWMFGLQIIFLAVAVIAYRNHPNEEISPVIQ